ncbi:hypothetical protein, partial [Paenibacillus sp. TCA20]|uniref:hypothetical protein n=1 Tax=Paenibacillus sp. TCA20 TaxID=1499968 RepID=UPI001EE649D3
QTGCSPRRATTSPSSTPPEEMRISDAALLGNKLFLRWERLLAFAWTTAPSTYPRPSKNNRSEQHKNSVSPCSKVPTTRNI